MTTSIWIGNLGKYTEGELVGEWVGLPHNGGDFSDVFKRIGVSDEPDMYGRYYDEWFVADIEMDYPIFEYCEYPGEGTLRKWSDLAERAEGMDEDDLSKAKAAIDCGWYSSDDFFQAAEDARDWIIYDADLRLPGQLGTEYADHLGGPKQLSESCLNDYFDYRTFGQDYRFESESDDYIVGSSANDEEIGRRVVDEYYGDIENVDDDLKDRYFDFVKFERDLKMEGSFMPYGQYGEKTLEVIN